jgi:adenine/guanine phosphoribosyltransferase-like PRPP-binding protein
MAVSLFGLTMDNSIISMIKAILFVAIIIFLSVRAGFDILYTKDLNPVINAVITGILGFATAGLLLSTLLTYVAGVPLLDMTLQNTAALSPVIQQSQLMQIMILQQDLWFALPALVLIGAGFMSSE